jgi:hypothetical protein
LEQHHYASGRNENVPKTSQLFSIFTFKYENKNEIGKTGHEYEHELTEYREFQINSSGIISNTIGIQKINTKY